MPTDSWALLSYRCNPSPRASIRFWEATADLEAAGADSAPYPSLDECLEGSGGRGSGGRGEAFGEGGASVPLMRTMRGGSNRSCVYVKQDMCLARMDYVSKYVIRNGRWRDCDSYVQMWRGLERDARRVGGMGAGEARLSAPGVMLEVGANVGACTVELLLRTRVRIIAFVCRDSTHTQELNAPPSVSARSRAMRVSRSLSLCAIGSSHQRRMPTTSPAASPRSLASGAMWRIAVSPHDERSSSG